MTVRRRIGQGARRRRKPRPAGLHLVSLMDIFTILVFFLLVNSSDVEVLDVAPDVHLPDSTAEHEPEAKLVVSVSGGEVRLNGKALARVADIADQAEIAALGAALVGRPREEGQRITIMADRGTPYALLAKILKTCERASYPAIAFAVNQSETSEDST